jgi:signal transduction histidine kinase/DNA-binding response OmpR family regulator
MNVRQYTILIVDDSVEDQELYRRYLSAEIVFNYQTIEVKSGEDGLAALVSVQPDLILLDYSLPDFTGLEFIEELKAQVGKTPSIIMLARQGSETVAVEAMKSGVKDYLVKGQITSQTLTNSVKNVLKQDYLQSLLHTSIQQQKLIAETALRIRKSLDLTEILTTAVQEIRLLLNCDRTVIYKFAPDMSGDILAESVKPGLKQSLGHKIVDTCFQNYGTAKYKRGETLAISNIYQAGLSPCHLKLLAEFQVQANAIVPILLTSASDKSCLWGLLIAHQCDRPRCWQTDEIELLDKLAVQMAIAIQQAELIANLKSELNTRKELETENVEYISTVIRSLSDQKKAEASLREKAEELKWSNQELLKITALLKKRNQELDRFAYITSHDLKAPLRAIANLATWLNEDLSGQIPSENQQQLELMQSRVRRMDRLIQGLLEYSRVGRKKTPLQTTNIKDVINDAIDSLAPPPEFEIAIALNMPIFLTEALLLQQVFTNLIDNAVKHHPKCLGKINIAVEDQAKFYQFGVSDDGLGIDPQYHERIFTIFQTLQARDTFDSTGIGLSIVKKIVEDQGGQVWVESQLGTGSTFYFTWRK